ncbi:MAG: site-specific DNA-methyltransferase [Firmicutes bacterium]|nr:site-specific DNA-methyltransferase [Bacillota bacterium]
MNTNFQNRVIIGDCRRILPALPDSAFDCVMTSPPYWQLRDYGNSLQIGREETISEYIGNLAAVFHLVKRVLKDSGSLWVNMADQYIRKDLSAIPWRLIFTLKEQGWILRNTLIWHKTNPVPASVKDRLNQDYEYLFHLTKKPDYYYDLDSVRIPHRTESRFSNKITTPDGKKGQKPQGRYSHNPKRQPGHPDSRAFHPLGKNPGCIITIPPKRSGNRHPASYPEELCRIPILTTCPPGGIVLDPFSGTGSTLKMAAKLGRNYTGIELNENYTGLAEEKPVLRNQVSK